MMSLYNLSFRWIEIANLCLSIDDEGEIPKELMFLLEEVESDIDAKLAGCVRVVRMLERQEEAVRAESRYLQEKAQRIERHAIRLKSYIKEQLDVMGWKSRQVDDLFSVSIAPSPDRVDILNLDSIPHVFDRPIDRQVNKSAILDAVRHGQAVPGVEVVHGTHLRIK